MKLNKNTEEAETVQTEGSQAVAQERLVSLAPINRPFDQYLGAYGYEPNGLKAQDDEGAVYCAVDSGIWEGWLVFRHPHGLWQSGRKLTDDDITQISLANATVDARPRCAPPQQDGL
jgi:hypothetical protein